MAITPEGVASLAGAGHQVVIEEGAGEGSGYSDDQFLAAGATVIPDAEEVWSRGDMILKVKEPLPSEYKYLREGQILFTYLHLAAEPELAGALKDAKVTAIAYETVTEGNKLPLLSPMSEIAGRMSIQIGAQLLEKPRGGKGILLGAVPGVKRGKVTIIGGGVVGTQAAKIAVGLGAHVTIIDASAERLRFLEDLFSFQVQTLMSSPMSIAESVADSDLVIGAVLIPGARAPKLVTGKMVQSMEKGSVIVDVAIDQGGIVETADRVATLDNPTYERHGVVHYAVPNMPAAVPRTSTMALTNVTISYALHIANLGLIEALKKHPGLQNGVNVMAGKITHPEVAKALNDAYTPLEHILES